MKLNRRRTNNRKGSEDDSEIKNLIDDLLVNGTGGDAEKWKRAFRYLKRDKRLMKTVMEIDNNKAFEVYYSLGEDRSLSKVSRMTNFNINKLVRWRKKFGWEKMIADRDNLVYDALKARAVTGVVKAKIDYSNIINKLIKEVITNMEDYNRKVAEVNKKAKNPKEMLPYKSLIYSAEDFERLVKLDLLMRGESTERKEVSIIDREGVLEEQIANDDTTKDLLKQLYRQSRNYQLMSKKINDKLPKARVIEVESDKFEEMRNIEDKGDLIDNDETDF